ncbi:MAG: hypothetical protein QOH84_2337 [Kribbellaceae bacterium]|nr:hypothetical protein [Kribbellaceae bacterium]
MSTAELEACLSRLYASADYLAAFNREPHLIKSDYQLTETEYERVTGIDRRRLRLFGSLVVEKRIEKLGRGLSRSHSRLADDFSRYVRRYIALRLEPPDDPPWLDLIHCGDFLSACLRCEGDAPSADLADLEASLLWARYEAPALDLALVEPAAGVVLRGSAWRLRTMTAAIVDVVQARPTSSSQDSSGETIGVLFARHLRNQLPQLVRCEPFALEVAQVLSARQATPLADLRSELASTAGLDEVLGDFRLRGLIRYQAVPGV